MCRGLCYIAFQTAAPNLRECPTNRWTGATGSEFRIKRDPAKLLGNAVARSTQTLCGSRFAMTNADPTATDLRRSLETCPACAGNLDDHSYARFAVTVAADENNQRLQRFCHALKARDWIALKLFDDFDPLRNALEATVLR